MAHGTTALKRFLCLFAQDHTDFRLQELHALSEIAGCHVAYEQDEYSKMNPFLIINLPTLEHGRQIMRRSLLIKSMYELWGHGCDYQQLRSSIENLSSSIKQPFQGCDYSFKLLVKGYNRKLSLAYQKQAIEYLEFLPFNGTVDLTNPQHEFHLLEDYGEDPNNSPTSPNRVFFGRLQEAENSQEDESGTVAKTLSSVAVLGNICEEQFFTQVIAHGQRHLIDYYSVKSRAFIGNTSMDAQLSLIMANQAKVIDGSLVLDPFAGTGSLLVASAHCGGYVLGTDINWTLLHGKGKPVRSNTKQKWRGPGESVFANLCQYHLESCYVDMLVSDSAHTVWREGELFDAIITDPPYGIREGGRKVGSLQSVSNAVSLDQREGHISTVCSYSLSDMYSDLLRLAVDCLKIGGRLVYWIPVIREEYAQNLLPSHPCLTLISSSEQQLSKFISRRLITMEKTNVASSTDESLSTSLLHNFRAKYFSKH